MLVIEDRNVNYVFPVGIMHLKEEGAPRESRNGPTLEIMEPVAVTYRYPDERVLFSTKRDANPFFHLFESLWMLAGRQDVGFLSKYNKRMAEYSDDGRGFNAAYGHRLRHHFGFDQIEHAVNSLIKNPDDRRVVLQIWDPQDLQKQSKDYACNLVLIPRIRDGYLDMTVMNRSNDYLWGMTGANVVHLSIIQEYIASHVGVSLGSYTQITNCLHAYTELDVWENCKDELLINEDPYSSGEVVPFPLISSFTEWDNDLLMWMKDPTAPIEYEDPFFNKVAKPMAQVFQYHKEYKDGLSCVETIGASDWRKAATQWLTKREKQLSFGFV